MGEIVVFRHMNMNIILGATSLGSFRDNWLKSF